LTLLPIRDEISHALVTGAINEDLTRSDLNESHKTESARIIGK